MSKRRLHLIFSTILLVGVWVHPFPVKIALVCAMLGMALGRAIEVFGEE